MKSPVGFRIESRPEPPAVFPLIQRAAAISNAEMHRVFNMGVGFCVIVTPDAADRVTQLAEASGFAAQRLGHCVADPERRVWLEPKSLVGKDGKFAAN